MDINILIALGSGFVIGISVGLTIAAIIIFSIEKKNKRN